MDVRSIIMGVVVAVSIGYILVWMMIPTKVYRETWLPKIQTFTNSTYFDSKGSTRLLMFTFPVLFVAILGCVYLHLRKNSSHTNFKEVKSKHDKLGIWRRRPLIIKWLGIVSRIELVFLLMFIALLVWSFSNDLYIHFADITPHSAAKFGKKVWEAKLEAVAVRLGIAGNTCLCFLFFPVTRGSSVLQLFELTSEASIKYHIWLGHMALTLFSAHGICYITFWTTTHQFSQNLEHLLSFVEKESAASEQNAIRPAMDALIADGLSHHPDIDVKVSFASCINEIVRITASYQPYDDIIEIFFELAVLAFGKLSFMNEHAYRKSVQILKVLEGYQVCVLMLDLELNTLIVQMFLYFLHNIRPDYIEKIMSMIIAESKEISVEILEILISSVKKEYQNVSPRSYLLGEIVLQKGSVKLRPYHPRVVKSLNVSINEYSPVVGLIWREALNSETGSASEHAEELVGCRVRVWWPQELYQKVENLRKISNLLHINGTSRVQQNYIRKDGYS